MTIQITAEQLAHLLASYSRGHQQRSFADCTTRFDGSKDRAKLQAFVIAVSIYKHVNGISDADALRGLPLLLEGDAATWWEGIKCEVTTWEEATDLMQAAFAHQKPGYQVYAELFGTKQEQGTATDSFIAQKRSLLSELPYELPKEAEIDMIYSLLRVEIKEKIPRYTFETFDKLIRKARELEEIEKEIQQARRQRETSKERPQEATRPQCSYCRVRGYTSQECQWKYVKKEAEQNVISWYDSEAPGYVRCKCPTCNQSATKQTNLEELSFYALSMD